MFLETHIKGKPKHVAMLKGVVSHMTKKIDYVENSSVLNSYTGGNHVIWPILPVPRLNNRITKLEQKLLLRLKLEESM